MWMKTGNQMIQLMRRTTKNKTGTYIPLIVSGLLLLGASQTFAQSDYKESSNNFARYTKSGDLEHLKEAKKFIDETYKTRRDSNNTRVNVLRAMIYSSMAYADSTRSIETPEDPIDMTYQSVNKIKKRDRENHASELLYVKRNLAASHIYKAKKALENEDYGDAYENYRKVKDLNMQNYDATYNLALLAAQTEQYEAAIGYYNDLLEKGDAPVEYYLELAEVYKKEENNQGVFNTLHEARTKFPDNELVLMNLIQLFAQNNEYKAIAPIIDEAVAHDPENIDLNYLAGYANENVGNIETAKKYYDKVLDLDPNNYESNLALGLIFLGDFLRDNENEDAQYQAQNLLLKANEIRPYDVNALKSLSIYYESSGDLAQLDRVKLLLNQLSNN